MLSKVGLWLIASGCKLTKLNMMGVQDFSSGETVTILFKKPGFAYKVAAALQNYAETGNHLANVKEPKGE